MITIYTKENVNCPIILNFDNEVTRLLYKEAGLELERKIHKANKELEVANQKSSEVKE